MISARDSLRSRACVSSPSPCSRSTAASCARCSPMRAPNRWCAPSRSSRAACRSSPSRSTSRPRPSALASRSSAWTTARVLRSAGPFRSLRCCSSCRFRASLRPGPRTRTAGARPGIRGSSANTYGPEGAPVVIRVTLPRPSFPLIRTSNRRSFRMSSRPRTLVALAAGAILGFCGALTSGVLADRPSEAAHSGHASRPVDGTALPWQEASLFAEVYERVKRDYVDDVDDHGLMEKALRGMVAALDPHSAFLDTEEFEEIRLSTMGSYPGVGIEVVAEDSAVKILRPIEGSPADQAGLLPGDQIVRIDDADIGADLAGAIARMRGSSGSVVKLTVLRPTTGQTLDFSLRRAKVEVHSVAQQSLEPGYGYLRITGFSETTADDVNRAVVKLKRDNPGGIRGLVLDLRNNPGGVLEAGVAVADAFLDEGVIVTADGRTPD